MFTVVASTKVILNRPCEFVETVSFFSMLEPFIAGVVLAPRLTVPPPLNSDIDPTPAKAGTDIRSKKLMASFDIICAI
jgi:hypothetical protein